MSNPNVAIRMVARPLGREHIPAYPKGFIAIRIVQLVLALIVLGLAGYGISFLPFDGNSLILAVAVLTLVSSIYHLVVEFGAPAGYNYWAILGLDIFFVVMWLIAFAILTAQVAPALSEWGSYYMEDFLATQITAAALGGVQFILYITSLAIHSVHLHRHRAAGLHCMPRSAGGGPIAPPGTIPVMAPYPQQQQMPQYPQQPGQQPQQQFYAPAPQGGYYMMPMPGQQQQMPPQQQQMMMMPGQQQMMPQQQQQQPPQNGFHAPPAPQPSQSPAPQLVPQPTGGSQATSTTHGGQGHGQGPQHVQGPQGPQEQQQIPQLPGN